jgi:Ca2+-binding RTX toxin-like protein
MTIWGCPVETSIVVDGSSESDGNLKIFGGTAGDTLIGGAGGDWFWGGLGADTLTGGAGADTFFYETAAESSAAGFDRLMSFDDTIDKIELDGHAVTGFAGPLSGALDGPTIGTQLEAAATTLGVDQALVFSVDGGGLNANTFLLIDGNDKAGYQAGGDFLILVSGAIGPVDNPGMFI